MFWTKQHLIGNNSTRAHGHSSHASHGLSLRISRIQKWIAPDVKRILDRLLKAYCGAYLAVVNAWVSFSPILFCPERM